MKFLILLSVCILLALVSSASGQEPQTVGGGSSSEPVTSGLWKRFQNFYRAIWRPFIQERFMKLRPPQSSDKISSRSIVEDRYFGQKLAEEEEDEAQRELKFKKINSPAVRYTENAIASLRGGLAWGPFAPRVATSSLTTLVNTVATSTLAGTLNFFQPTIFSDVSVTGVITGLNAHEVINVHVRTRGDISANCANQGDVYNPTLTTLGAGGNIGTFTANAAGVATIDVPKLNAVNVDMYENSIIGRSIRVSRTNNAGLPRACGIVGFP